MPSRLVLSRMSLQDDLARAVQARDVDGLKRIVPPGFKLSIADGLLELAVQADFPDVIAVLLSYLPSSRADWDASGWGAYVPELLHRALSLGRESTVDVLLTKNPHFGFHEALILAMKENKVDAFEKLFRRGRVTHFGALQSAVELRCTEAINIVLEDPACKLGQDYRVDGLVASAITSGYLEAVNLLLAYPGYDPNAGGCLALRMSARCGGIDMLEAVLRHPRVDLSKDGGRALVEAAAAGNLPAVNCLLADARIRPGEGDNAAFCSACFEKHLPVIERLMADERVDPAARNNEPLRLAVQRNRREVVELLLRDKRVDPSAMRNAAVRALARAGDVDLLKRLLTDDRVDPAATASELLVKAATGGNLAALDVLLADARIDAAACGSAALLAAAKFGQIACLRRLLADPRVDASFDDGALLAAAAKSTARCAAELIDVLLDALLTDSDARFDAATRANAAFRGALRAEQQVLVIKLLAHPAVDPSIDDNAAIRVAARRGWLPVVERLLADLRVDPAACGNEALRSASAASHTAVVLRLLQDERVDPAIDDNEVLRELAWCEPVDEMARDAWKVLLAHPRADPGALDSEALYSAVKSGNLLLVRALLQHPRVDPAAAHNRAVRAAVRYRYASTISIDIFYALMADERVDVTDMDDAPGGDTLAVAINYAPDRVVRQLFQIAAVVNRELRRLSTSRRTAYDLGRLRSCVDANQLVAAAWRRRRHAVAARANRYPPAPSRARPMVELNLGELAWTDVAHRV